jgi:hypothetical protein
LQELWVGGTAIDTATLAAVFSHVGLEALAGARLQTPRWAQLQLLGVPCQSTSDEELSDDQIRANLMAMAAAVPAHKLRFSEEDSKAVEKWAAAQPSVVGLAALSHAHAHPRHSHGGSGDHHC